MYDFTAIRDTETAGKIADLSATSVALFLSAISDMRYRFRWTYDGASPTDTEYDEIDSAVSLAIDEIMASLVGMIFPHAMATVSAFKFLPCDGGIYLKEDYPLLYDALDATYIVSGTQFRVPDLRDRVPVGSGNNYALDDSGGVDSVTLTVNQIPAHSHTFYIHTFGIDIESVGVPDPTGVGQPELPRQTSSVGGGESHENRMPYRALNYVIVAG